MQIKRGGCDSPVFIKLPHPRYSGNQPIYSVNVACGKCANCIKRRVNQWAFRLLQEDLRSTSAYFITLTYDTDHVPLTSKLNMTLCRKDVQKFFKRLRYYHETDGVYLSEIRRNNKIKRQPIKYFACGEYGGLFGRPHYHAIIFNAFPDNFEKAWAKCITKPSKEFPDGIWEPFGNIQFRECDRASIFYTLKYMDKHLTDWSYDPEIVPEFSLKSKGLGSNYITDETKRHHSSNLDNNYVMSDMFKVALPKYYQRHFWPDSKDGDGRTIPHPHRLNLLGHIKKVVQDTTDEQRHIDEISGLNPDLMDSIRKKARNSKINSVKNRKF